MHQKMQRISKTCTAIVTVLVFVTVGFISQANAQIVDVEVSVNTEQISSESDYLYVTDLEHELTEYIENANWTDDNFQDFESIRMRMQIVINDVDNGHYSANLVVTSHRPIFNTMQLSPLMIINDTNWNFDYNRGQNLIFDQNRYDNLTSVIDYYTYLVLGFDYDSFSPLGGTPFLRRAERIVDLAQTSGASGWGGSGSSSRRTRYHLINNLLNPNYEPLRMAVYRYHRHGLDQFIASTEEARENALEAFELIDEARRNTTDNYPFDIIFDTKYREFTAFFIDATPEMRVEAYNLLTDIDRGNDSEYEKLQQ